MHKAKFDELYSSIANLDNKSGEKKNNNKKTIVNNVSRFYLIDPAATADTENRWEPHETSGLDLKYQTCTLTHESESHDDQAQILCEIKNTHTHV